MQDYSKSRNRNKMLCTGTVDVLIFFKYTEVLTKDIVMQGKHSTSEVHVCS